MKTTITILLFFLTKSLFVQQFKYVNAENDFTYREITDNNINRPTYGSSTLVAQETDIELQLKNGSENINEKGGRIQEIEERPTVSTHSRHLMPNEPSNIIEIKFKDFSLQMELDAWDKNGDLEKIHDHTAKVYLEIGETVEGKKVKINQSKYRKIEVFQRHENSITIMNEGPHCDMTEWKHYYSEWNKLDYNMQENTFVSDSYTQKDRERFIDVDINAFKKAAEKECGVQWAEHIKNVNSVGEYPSGVSISRIYYKILLTDDDGIVTEKIISFEIPMGC